LISKSSRFGVGANADWVYRWLILRMVFRYHEI